MHRWSLLPLCFDIRTKEASYLLAQILLHSRKALNLLMACSDIRLKEALFACSDISA